MKKRLLSLALTLVLCTALTPLPASALTSNGGVQPGASAQPDAASRPLSFSDVKSGDWFYPYVTELVEAGDVNGYEDGTFRPNDSITRDAVCTILPGSFLSDKNFDAAADTQMMSKAQNPNGDYWANRFIGQANLCGIEDLGFGRAEWGKPATREEIAYMLSCVYACAQLVAWKQRALANLHPDAGPHRGLRLRRGRQQV